VEFVAMADSEDVLLKIATLEAELQQLKDQAGMSTKRHADDDDDPDAKRRRRDDDEGEFIEGEPVYALLVPDKAVKRIVGKGGGQVQEIEEDFGCQIHVGRGGGVFVDHVLVKVRTRSDSGNPIDAIRKIVTLINPKDQDDSIASTIVLFLPYSAIGRVVGKGGEVIRQLSSDSGAKIDIQKDRSGVCSVTGPMEDLLCAIRMVYEQVGGEEVEEPRAGTVRVDIPDRRREGSMGRSQDPVYAILVSQECVPRIVGKGGSQVKEIEEDFRCKVDVSRNAVFQGHILVKVRNNGGVAIDALRKLITIAEHKGLDEREQKISVCVLLPVGAIQRVVGRGGENIKRTQDSTDVKIDIDRDRSGRCLVLGFLDNICRAIEIIYDHVGPEEVEEPSQDRRGGRPGGDPRAMEHDRRGGGGGGRFERRDSRDRGGHGGGSRYDSRRDEETSSWYVLVPMGVISVLVGPQGSTVRAMSDASGAYIDIQKQADKNLTHTDKLVTIRGSVNQKYEALREVLTKVERTREFVPEIGFRFLVPADAGPRIVGSGGSRVREIGQGTNTRIDVHREELETSPEYRIVSCKGPAASVAQAYEKVMEAVDEEDGRRGGSRYGGRR